MCRRCRSIFSVYVIVPGYRVLFSRVLIERVRLSGLRGWGTSPPFLPVSGEDLSIVWVDMSALGFDWL